MDYVKLGRTGLEVSPICLGTMSYGASDQGTHPWSLGPDVAREHITRAVELGINFFDTANVYSAGTSEEYVGKALREVARREEVVIATKVHGTMHPGPNGGGLSRKVIMAEIDNSACAGSVRTSSTSTRSTDGTRRRRSRRPSRRCTTWSRPARRATSVRRRCTPGSSPRRCTPPTCNGWTRFVSMQDHYNLLNREEEREMLPLCASEGIGVIPWSPLARGRLTRDWDDTTARSETDEFGKILYDTASSDREIAARVASVAAARGVPRAQVALAWLVQQPTVTAPIVGATKVSHIEDAVAALSLELTAEEIATLEEPYVPHGIVGFS